MSFKSDWGKREPEVDFENWPKTEDGELVAPAFLLHTDSFDYDDVMTMNMLKAFGIPVVKRYPHNGEFGKIIIGMSGEGVDLFVPETMLADAHNILSAEIEEDEQLQD